MPLVGCFVGLAGLSSYDDVATTSQESRDMFKSAGDYQVGVGDPCVINRNAYLLNIRKVLHLYYRDIIYRYYIDTK